MSSPSALGDIGFPVTAVLPLSTTTALIYIKATGTDTGTVALTGRAIDLSKVPHYGSTGGKPLDATVHNRPSGMPRWKSALACLAGEWTSHTSGKNLYITTTHQTRAATSGAGSTWRTLKANVDRFKMGTDTDAVFHLGVGSSVNLQGADRFYRANHTISFKMASSTSAKDTTTNQAPTMFNSGVIILSGGDSPTNVPYRVS
jgi:hypothetical protein